MIYHKHIGKNQQGNININIEMRPIERTDMYGDYYKNWFHDPEVTKHNSHGIFPHTRKQQDEFMDNLENTNSQIVWAIFAEVNYCTNAPIKMGNVPIMSGTKRQHIGNCSLQRIDYINRSAEFAILIGDKNFWGKGICTIALNTLLEHAFKRLGLNRVWTGTASTNIGMQKAIKKCGLKQEGTFKEGMFLDGKFVDIYEYAILAEDYFKIEV